MVDKVDFAASTYTDIQGLNSLRQEIKNNPSLAKKGAAKQFEALMVQMLLKTMRESTRSLSSEKTAGGDQMAMYEDLLDKQISMSTNNFGIAEIIEKSLNHAQNIDNAQGKTNPISSENKSLPVIKSTDKSHKFTTAESFVNNLWSLAKDAAGVIGLDPKFMLAQAALETNWGKNIINHVTGASSNILFNIKAGSGWQNDSVIAKTTEEEKDNSITEQAKFRSYNSLAESFKDYVKFLQSNERYREALAHTSSPEQFAEQLQKANFATDKNYADKIMKIFNSQKFNALFNFN